jgi:hypothetical protein
MVAEKRRFVPVLVQKTEAPSGEPKSIGFFFYLAFRAKSIGRAIKRM